MHGNEPVFHEDGEPRTSSDLSTSMLRVAAICAVAFWLASYLPPALVGLAMAQFLTVAAFASATVAALLRQHLFAAEVTRWDEAALLGFVSLLAASTVDPEAARLAADSLGNAGVGGAS